LRAQDGLDKLLGKQSEKLKHEDAIDTRTIEGSKTRSKSDKESRIAAMLEGREGREKYGSRKGNLKLDKPHSSTNREKARKKNFLMILGQAKKKQKRSLVEHRR